MENKAYSFSQFEYPLQMVIIVPVQVQTFGTIGSIASALSQIEGLRKEFNVIAPAFPEHFQQRSYKLRYFRVNSPAEISMLLDPAWLAVFLGTIAVGISALQLLASYPQLKTGIKELTTDMTELSHLADEVLSRLSNDIQGLTKEQIANLQKNAALYKNAIVAASKETIESTLKRVARIAKSLGVHREKHPTMLIEKDQDLTVDIEEDRDSDN